MKYFAKLIVGNKVEKVVTLLDNIAPTEQAGRDFLNNLYKTNDLWFETYKDGSLRKNYAGIGYKYDQARDAFIAPKPYASWILNENTCIWEAPVAYPTDGQIYIWNETNKSWNLRE
tara:strand:- start:987 stop:1334 length:348 start_codon:yes stop_codon:yes gene_type:complete